MQLPVSWVDSLFARFAVRYGAAWLRQWDGVDIVAVKADWAAELGGYGENPEAIKHALEHLPASYPPKVGEFLELCHAAPRPEQKWLTVDKADKKVVGAIMTGLKRAEKCGPRDWAHRLRAREVRCDRLTKFQRSAWREALKTELENEARTVEMA